MTVEVLEPPHKYESSVVVIYCPKCDWPHPFVKLKPPKHYMSLIPNNEGMERFSDEHPMEKLKATDNPCNKCGTVFKLL